MTIFRISGCCADEYRLCAPNWTLRFQGANCGILLDDELISCDQAESAEIAQEALTHFIQYPCLDDIEVIDGQSKPTATEIIAAIEAWILREKS